MPAKKDANLRKQRISELLNRISEIESLKDELRSEVDLGKNNQPLTVSLESFIQFNFDLSQDLESYVEEKMLDEYQKEWDEWGTIESEREPLNPTSRCDLPSHPK